MNLLPFCFVLFVSLKSSVEGQQADNLPWRVKKVETLLTGVMATLDTLNSTDAELAEAVTNTSTKITDLGDDMRNITLTLAAKDGEITESLKTLKSTAEELEKSLITTAATLNSLKKMDLELAKSLNSSRSGQEKMRRELDGWNAKFTDHFVTMPGEILYAIQSTTLRGDSAYTADKAYDVNPDTQSYTIHEANPWYRAWLARKVRIMSFTINMYSHYTTNVYTIYTLGENGAKTSCASFKPGTAGRSTQIIGCGLEGHGFEITVYNGGSGTYMTMYDLKLEILLI